ncbi:MAG: hypothetical protein H6807_00880 [Planctomycetes bacterium]|nr:hypothetical protein [Planctomycetota bacterium]
MNKNCVFIHTNHKQILGALVAEYCLRRNSARPDDFDVKLICTEDHAFLKEMDGQKYLRDGVERVWLYEDLQSFTPLRFMPPELMGYEGRAVVIDPDIFAVADVMELFDKDMDGKAILCRMRSGPKGYIDKCMASSVMLLDCAKLGHWKCEEQFRAMFRFERDYQPWICLKLEDRETIGFFENEWNDFDKLTSDTKMLHNTRRRTQPWKTGLPVDWRPAERFRLFPPVAWVMRARRKLFGEYAFLGNYKQHPDPNQEIFFFGMLKEMLDKGLVNETMVREQMAKNHVRHDALEVLDRTPELAPPGRYPLESLAAS